MLNHWEIGVSWKREPCHSYVQGMVANHIRFRENVEESRSLNTIDVCMRGYVIKFQRVRRRMYSWKARSRARTISRGASNCMKSRTRRFASQRRSDDNGEARSVTRHLFIHRSMIFRATKHARDYLKLWESETIRVKMERHWCRQKMPVIR